MHDESLFVSEGLENIKKTQSALQSLETKLNQYVSRSRESTEKRAKQPALIMPTIYLQFSSRKSAQQQQSHKPSRQSTPQQAEVRVPTPPLESEFEYYKHRLKSIAPNLSKVEEFYQKRTAMLEDKVRDLEDRKDKVRRDRELLAKENRRLQAELQQATDQHSRNQHNRRLQTEEIQARGRKAKQDRLKHLQHEIQREKEVGEGLKVQVDSYQSSLKLMLELQKNLTSIDIESRELKRPSTGSKSKSTISKQPNRHHRHCCSSTFASTQKVKSKSVTAK